MSYFVGGERGIRTPVGLHPNGFQDRLVMTASISLRMVRSDATPVVPTGGFPRSQHYKAYHTLEDLSRGFGIFYGFVSPRDGSNRMV